MNPQNLNYHIEKLRVAKTPEELTKAIDHLEADTKVAQAEYDKDSSEEYWDTIKGIAQDILNEGIEEDKDPDALSKWVDNEGYDKIHEAVDGNYWVIYTHANLKALTYSPNESAMFDEGMEAKYDNFGELTSAMTFWAMCADVREELKEMVEKYEEDYVEPEDEEDEDEDEDEEEGDAE